MTRFSRYLLPYWDKQAVLYCCLGISMLLGLITPYLTSLVIDYALLARDLYLFNLLLLVGIISYLFSVPIEFIQKYTGFYLNTQISLALRAHFYKHLQRLSLRFAQSRTTGEHLYRLGPDVEGVVALITNSIPGALVFLVRFSLLLAICLWLDWQLTVCILAAAPLIYLHTRYFTHKQYALGRTITETSQGVSSRLQDTLAHINLIKIFGRERGEYRRYLQDILQLIRLNVENVKIALTRAESGRLLKSSVFGGMTYYLGYQLIRDRMTLGQMTALSLYLFQLLSALRSIGGLYNDFVMKFIAMDRVLETLDAEVEVRQDPQALRHWQARGAISFEGVTFGYRKDRPVLQDVSFSLAPGQYAAFAGPSGAGKSTLVQLLLRLYDPWQGTIRLDGHDCKRLAIRTYRKNMGLAMHDPSLLAASVLDNIRFGNPNATMEEVIEAARIAEAHEFIEALPAGYATDLEGGKQNISLGQQQRIALARALVMQPKILILDEAMSSLNSDLESAIIANIRRHRPETLLIVISHRLSAIRGATLILVVNNHSIEAQGTHAQLAKSSKTYNRLYQQQFVEGGTVMPLELCLG